jgi:hypothetical protein
MSLFSGFRAIRKTLSRRAQMNLAARAKEKLLSLSEILTQTRETILNDSDRA